MADPEVCTHCGSSVRCFTCLVRDLPVPAPPVAMVPPRTGWQHIMDERPSSGVVRAMPSDGVIDVDRAVLYAFAQLHEGERFNAWEVHCRFVQAVTDEGYPTSVYVLEVFWCPEDRNWHENMVKTYGEGPHDVVFFRDSFEEGPQLVERATEYLRTRVFKELRRARESYERVVALVEGLNNEG